MHILFVLFMWFVMESIGFRRFPVHRHVKDTYNTITCSLSTSSDEQRPTTKKITKKRRVDELLIERQQVANKDEVEKLIMTGNVMFHDNGEIITSSALKIDVDREIRIRLRKNEPYVSRAGRKLAYGIETFNLSKYIVNQVCIDLGSSTGGFCDVLLQQNCTRVYAVDVGVSLMDWKIRNDPRVCLLEKHNARYLNASQLLSEDAVVNSIGVVVCDVSFISLKSVLSPSLQMCKEGAVLCALIKPQFECGRNELSDGGIVRDQNVRERVIASILIWFQETHVDWDHLGTIESPITGHDGNIEYLFVARKKKKQQGQRVENVGGIGK